MARAITATPVLEGKAAKRFVTYLSTAKADPQKAERLARARDLYRHVAKSGRMTVAVKLSR